MNLNTLDVAVFLAFFGFVVAFAMFKGRHEKTGEDYFLAGRGLIWPLVGLWSALSGGRSFCQSERTSTPDPPRVSCGSAC